MSTSRAALRLATIERLTPERLASLLSLVVLSALAVIVVSPPTGAPSVSAVPATGSPGAIAPPRSPAASTPGSAEPAAGPPQAAVQSLVVANGSILALREELLALADTGNATSIVRSLRRLNSLLLDAEARTAAVLGQSNPVLATALTEIYQASQARSRETLRSSVSSTTAYVSGARAVAELLRPLSAENERLASTGGAAPASAVPAPSPSVST